MSFVHFLDYDRPNTLNWALNFSMRPKILDFRGQPDSQRRDQKPQLKTPVIGKSKLNGFSSQFKIIHYASYTKSCLKQNSYSIFIHKGRTDFCSNVRFFAAPVQFQNKPSKEDKKTTGPRLNEKITAHVVRLVMDKEHSIVSRHEALERARRLDLDLVEIQASTDPPVCKIMDFHKEQYQKQLRDKDRAKSKPEVTLRTGSSKEVRFSGKTEHKDLQMKADSVKRLMEEGYRVKCNARGSADQDLLGVLSRLSALIEDIAVVESGPLLGKDGAYVIVRHAKFGSTKKGGGKKIKALEEASSEAQEDGLTPASDSRIAIDDVNAVDSALETNDESFFAEVGQSRSSSMGSSNSDFHGSDKQHSFHDSIRSSETSDITENRYRKGGARNQFSPTQGMDSGNPGMRHSTRLDHFSNQGRQPPSDTNFSQQTRESKDAVTSVPGFRNRRPPPNEATRREPFSPRPGYGIFSDSKANAPGNHGVQANTGGNREENRYSGRSPTRGGLASNQNFPSSKFEGRQPPSDTHRQGGWGMFSREPKCTPK
ncbi:Translation initiation factor [Parasponia andersonii]|uniref:Translation initiation factor n=1 Tax=Parasponia andersonii TaxID=3476 RepID=A0A2P5B8K2_PARAD|nr:Translation initiation factor [Parasponia andersonii]